MLLRDPEAGFDAAVEEARRVARHSAVSARMVRHHDAIGLVRPTGRYGTGTDDEEGGRQATALPAR